MITECFEKLCYNVQCFISDTDSTLHEAVKSRQEEKRRRSIQQMIKIAGKANAENLLNIMLDNMADENLNSSIRQTMDEVFESSGKSNPAGKSNTAEFFEFVSKIDTLSEQQLNDELNKFIDKNGNLTFTIDINELRETTGTNSNIIDTTATIIDDPASSRISIKDALCSTPIGKKLFTELNEAGEPIEDGVVNPV